MQVLDNCLEVATAKSDSGKNAKACAADIKAANAKMLKLGHRVACISKCFTAECMTPDFACICKYSDFLSRWKSQLLQNLFISMISPGMSKLVSLMRVLVWVIRM